MERTNVRKRGSLIPALKALLGIGDKEEKINEKEVAAFNQYVEEAAQILRTKTTRPVVEPITPEQTIKKQPQRAETINRRPKTGIGERY